MNKFFASALMTIVAVPFLSAAPHSGAGKGQNSTATTATAAKSTAKTRKHAVKAKKNSAVKTNSVAPAAAPNK